MSTNMHLFNHRRAWMTAKGLEETIRCLGDAWVTIICQLKASTLVTLLVCHLSVWLVAHSPALLTVDVPHDPPHRCQLGARLGQA